MGEMKILPIIWSKKNYDQLAFRKSVTNDIYSEYYENRKKTHLNCKIKSGRGVPTCKGVLSWHEAVRMSDKTHLAVDIENHLNQL